MKTLPLAPSPEHWPPWLRGALFASLVPAAIVPFVPFVGNVTPWDEIARGVGSGEFDPGIRLMASQSLFGLVMLALGFRILLGGTPSKIGRRLMWIASAAGMAFAAWWWISMVRTLAESWPAPDSGETPAAIGALVTPPLCIVTGSVWLWCWRQQFARRVALPFALLRLAYGADVGFLAIAFGTFPRSLGWYCATLPCMAMAAELLLLALSRAEPARICAEPKRSL